MSSDASRDAAWPDGYGLIWLDETTSTNDDAARLAPELDRPTWIAARRQTGGRGRQGRPWIGQEGNLFATLVMRPTGTAGWAALRSFLAANALFEALALHVDRTRLALKWPNDVLLDEGKVAGILLESAGSAARVDWLAIGIGVNLARAPAPGQARGDFAPVSLADAGVAVPAPDEFLASLADFYATEEAILERLGFPPIRDKWLRRAARLGEIISARTSRGTVSGRFEDIDEAGRLILVSAQGRHAISAADVYF